MHGNGGSKAGEILWVVTDDELEILPRNQVCRAAGEIYARRNHTQWNKPSLESLSKGTDARAFFKVYEHPMSSGRRVYQSEERSFRSGKPKEMFDSIFRTRRTRR